MKSEQEIRWLQISDLHMFNSTDLEYQKKSLVNQFGAKTDFIVVSGDLHQYRSDYSMTIRFLEHLVDGFNIRKKDVYIVPGNHDALNVKKRNEAIKRIDENIENNPDIYINELNSLYSGFKSYQKFLNDFYEDVSNEYNWLENNIFVWENKLAILCLNTALVSDESHSKPQIIDIYGLAKLENNKRLPCISIMHHDFYAISEMHKPYLLSAFRALEVSAVLSGHKHKTTKSKIDLENGEIIPNYCCGKSVSQPGDLWSDVGIIEYRWKRKENEVMVIPYQWDRGHNKFSATIRFENVDKGTVDDEGKIMFEQKFCFGEKDSDKVELKESSLEKEEEKDRMSDLEFFYKNVQSKYLDGILESIGTNEEKFGKAIDIMERIVTYNGKKIEFNEVVDLVISCKEKVVLAIKGLQGTGKSTFLSLVYSEIKNKIDERKVFPILIDLHALDNYSKKQAKEILLNDLDMLDKLIKKYADSKFILLFDGVDEYVRKTSELEDVMCKYVEKNNLSNFAFCIGSADYLPNEMCKTSKLEKVSRKAVYKLEANTVRKNDEESINVIISNLITIYGFAIKQNEICMLKKAIGVYTINKIDYRTLLIILRVFVVSTKKKNEYQLGKYFYDYYLVEMNSDEKELFKHAKATYQYIVEKNMDALRTLKYAKIIYNNGITIDFLLAYYFICLIKKGGKNLQEILKKDFIFTASVNKFIKDLILNKYEREQSDIVEKMIEAYAISGMSMKSQINYILGRIQDNNAKEKAKKFLISQWEQLYNKLFREDKIVALELDIKSELVLFRTTSVSLIWLGYDKKQEQFLRCLLLNEKLNEINRVFHLEYYEDKAYMNGTNPTYVDDENISVDKTMSYLINNINKVFSKSANSNKPINLDIITLFSIYQYRMRNESIREKYEDTLKDLSEKIIHSPKIQSKTIINYVTTVKNLLLNNPYANIVEEMYKSKIVKREGWIRRMVDGPESIADHMYGCYLLGMFFLPNNVHQCIDYNIPDIEEYSKYSKDTILEMILLHDLAEVRFGDIVTPEKGVKDVENESNFFNYSEFLCSFPHVYGLGNQKKLWDEFNRNSTINAKIANDVDKIEPLIQAYVYKKRGNKIDLNEWMEYARKNVNTSLGKQFLQFVIDKIII